MDENVNEIVEQFDNDNTEFINSTETIISDNDINVVDDTIDTTNTTNYDYIIVDNSLVDYFENRDILTTNLEDYTIVEILLVLLVVISFFRLIFNR